MFELIVVVRVLLLSTCAIVLLRLRQPLIHCRLNQFPHVVSQHITIVHRVIDGCTIEGVAQEGIQIRIKALSDELDISTFDSHHERCHS